MHVDTPQSKPPGPTMAFDVCVFGAGPAGIAVGLRLAAMRVSVVLLDRRLATKPWGGESFTAAIRKPLEALGCWKQFENAGHRQVYERQSAWGSEPCVESSVFRLDGPLWHVDRERFDDDLRATAYARAIPLLLYRKLNTITRESDAWCLSLDAET